MVVQRHMKIHYKTRCWKDGKIIMRCKECYWCNNLGTYKVWRNKESKNNNTVLKKEDTENLECKDAESVVAVDYRNMTPWEFAVKYY